MKNMKKALCRILALITVLAVAAVFLTACGSDGTVTFEAKNGAVVSVKDESGKLIESGTVLKNGTKIVVTVTVDEGHTAHLTVNGAPETLTNNQATLTVRKDLRLEGSQTATQHTVTITAQNGIGLEVKHGETVLTSGAKIKHGETLHIKLTPVTGHTAVLTLNGTPSDLANGQTQHIVTGDITINATQSLYSDAAVFTRTGRADFDGAHRWTGSFEGATGGTDIASNLTVPYNFEDLENGELYTRGFNVTQIKGEPGTVQLLAYDGDYDKAEGGGKAGVYWNVVANMDALGDDGIGASAAMTNFYENAHYTGYWGSVKGNTYQKGVSAQEGSFMFLASNEGEYIVFADIVKVENDSFTVVSRYTLHITAVDAEAEMTLTASPMRNITDTKWDFMGSYTGTAGGADITENIQFRYDLTRDNHKDLRYIPLVRVEGLSGTDVKKVQLHMFYENRDGDGVYWDVLKNFGALNEMHAMHAEDEENQNDLTVLALLKDQTGHHGFLGDPLKGSLLKQYESGVNEKHVTKKIPVALELISEEAGVFLITVDFFEYAEGFESLGSYSVLVTVEADENAEMEEISAKIGTAIQGLNAQLQPDTKTDDTSENPSNGKDTQKNETKKNKFLQRFKKQVRPAIQGMHTLGII
ncbi:MAG: hypothetical protein FWH03_04795 [Firmicutes bacterium]|nr:hypothetical protein [Bacillota bacterium]